MNEQSKAARKETLRRAAIIGLDTQLQRLTKHNAVDKEDLVTDIKRALTFMKEEA